jgi:hemerythrin superfamily protein
MTKQKRNLLFIASAVFVLAICIITVGGQANAHEEDEQGINQGQNLVDDDDTTSDDRNATSENGSENKDEDENDDSATSTGRERSEEHRSAVANFVRGLLDVANREENGIGEQVRVVAKEQNDSASTTARAIEKVEKRSKIRTFLFGSDYKNLGALRSEIVKTRNRIDQLNRILENIQNASSTADLQGQIQTLEQEQTKLEDFVKENENKISLFGWLVRLFNK